MNCLESPLMIELLLHYHTSPEPHPHAGNKRWKEAHEELLEDKIIYYNATRDCYMTTQLGQAWVKALCQLPPPKQVYVDQLNNIIELP